MKLKLHLMKSQLLKLCALILFGLISLQANSQFLSSAPTLDGTADAGYVTSGAWSLAWDETYLYVRYSGGGATEPVIMHIDIDPQIPVSGGSNSNGALVGQANWSITPTLPFRSDFQLYWESQYAEYRTDNGSGSWNSPTVITTSDRSNTGSADREIRITWTSMGASGRPSSFNWCGFANSRATPGYIFNQIPGENPSTALSTPRLNYYFTVSNTSNSGTTNPFARKCFEQRSGNGDVFISSTNTLYDVTNNANNLTDEIVIENNSTSITLNIEGTAHLYGGLTINSSDAISISNGGNVIMNANGFLFVNSGTLSYNQTSSSLTYQNGSSYNMSTEWPSSNSPVTVTVTNNSTLNITGSRTINSSGSMNIQPGSALTISTGTLTTNGNLTLRSDATGTARIGNSAGSISGNLTVERYIPGGSSRRRTRLLASPVVGGTALQWRNNGTNASGLGIQITGSGGASNGFDVTNNTNNPPSAWSYDPTLAAASSNSNGSDWVPFTSGSMTLTNGAGYRVLVRGDRTNDLTTQNSTTTNTTVWVSGSYPGSSVTISTTRSSAFSNGWNLVGNPYPSPISWSALTKGSDLDASYWVFDPATNTYVTHNGTTGTGNNIIGSGQAFFVRRNSGTTGSAGDLTISESHKTSGSIIYMGKSQIENLEFIMTYDSNNVDRGIIAFDDSYEDAYDKMDAEKLSNPSINISSLDEAGNRLSINSMKKVVSGQQKIVKLDIRNSVLASYTLSFDKLESMEGTEILLKDKFLNKIEKVTPELKYSFTLSSDSSSFGSERFELIFSKSATGLNNELSSNNNNFIVFPNPANNVLNLSLTTSKEDNYSYSIFNQLGAEVSNGNLDFNSKRTHALNIESLSNGVYFIQVKNGKTAQTIKFIK